MTALARETGVGGSGRRPEAFSRGAEHMRQLGLMVQWQVRRSGQYLPLLVVVQVMLAVATVVGYGLLAGNPDRIAGLYLATGAPTITLITVGLVMTPQTVLQSKTEGSLDWLRTLPAPREVFLLADLVMWTLIALPGTVVGVVVGALTFGVTLSPTWWLVPSILLVSLVSASLGYAIGTLLPPTVAQLISQVLVFTVMLFTPISYPSERLPGWARILHEWLPLEPMAQAVRAGLAPQEFSIAPRSWIVLIVWCAISVLGAGLALRRRG
ncbi:ABC transporter permease [Propionicicella superfundia]|uniref:ABC transporter permease n=1 Tax=Propionicicella superfundia TaxID=348582 RepID=UPI0004290D20|nr:ABC transporter permease [Propionicicella superfundia]